MKNLTTYLSLFNDIKDNIYGLTLENRIILLNDIKYELSCINCNPINNCEYSKEIFHSIQMYHIKCEYLSRCFINDSFNKEVLPACPFKTLLNDINSLKLK